MDKERLKEIAGMFDNDKSVVKESASEKAETESKVFSDLKKNLQEAHKELTSIYDDVDKAAEKIQEFVENVTLY